MTIPMDNSKENPSKERVQSLFNKNVELENSRRKAAQARVPSDPSIWQQMRENYETIILEDHAFSEQHDIEYALWQLHYRRIEELRALLNAALASAGSAAPQNGKGPVRSGHDRLAKIRSQFKTFVSEATGFYHDLMLKIRSKYGLPLGHFSGDSGNQIPLSKDGNRSSEVKKGLISCHRCLIYLGDLARYKGLYGEGDSKARDFVAASSYYLQASSLWPSSGNPHHQLAILAGYSNDELVSIYRYFRSLAVDTPFITARDNLIIAFEKNRQNYIQLLGDGIVPTMKTAPSRMSGKGRRKGETRSSFKDTRVENSSVSEKPANPSELLKVFFTRFIRLNGVLFTRTSLETFAEVFSIVKRDLLELLSTGPNDTFNFGSDAAECRLAIVRMTAILIFTVHNAKKESENQSYADILQRSVLLQNAFTATFEFMGSICERCTQLNDPSSSYLLPGIMVFVEWLACCHDVAVGRELEDRQMNARSFFWNKCISLLNKLLSSGYSFINNDEDETCFSNMSKYDETETANRLALPEDSELRGFTPLLPAQLILDFSRNHSFGGDVGNKERSARVHRIIAAGKALANIVQIDQEGVYFDPKLKKFVSGVESQVSGDYSPAVPLDCNSNGGIETSVGYQMSAIPRAGMVVEAEDEDEVIVFKPPTSEKHMEEPYPKMTSSEVLASVGDFGKVDFANGNGMEEPYTKMTSSEVLASVGDFGKVDFVNGNGPFSGGHDSLLLQTALSGSMRTSSPVANGASQYPPPIQPCMSKWPAEQVSVLNGLSHLNFMENGLSLKNEVQGQFGVSQPAALSVPYPQFVTGNNVSTQTQFVNGNNVSTQVPQAASLLKFNSFLSSGSATDIPFTRPSSTIQPDLKKHPVSRPVRHFGPPPGFGSVRSKVMDESLNNMALKNENPSTLQMDDYSWLDGHNFSSSNQSVGFTNAINQAVGPTFHTVSKGNSSIAGFPFPGKQVSTLHIQNEKQNGWPENMKLYEEQQENFKRESQPPVGPPHQYHGQSLWEGRFFV